MAKEQTNIQDEKFTLTDRVREEGYHNKNYNLEIDFEKNYKGERLTRFASVGKMVNGEFVSDKADYLTGLSEEQVYNLAVAKVIKLKKAQWHYFLDYLKKIVRAKEED